MIIKKIITGLGVVLVAALASGQATSAVDRPSIEVRTAVDVAEGITYAKYGSRSLQLDLYRPHGQSTLAPAIVCIHGGGWAKGTRANFARVARRLAEQGYVAVAISYRLSGEAKFPAQIHDVKAAVRWLRARATDYGIDRDRIGVIGHSAGGHLAALLATSCGTIELEGGGGNGSESSCVQAAVVMDGQTAFESARNAMISADPAKGEMWRQFLGGSQQEVPEVYRSASPLHYLDKADPPVAFVAGEQDDPSTHADEMRAAMEKNGRPSLLHVISGAPHNFLTNPRWFDEGMQVALEFFDVHLKRAAR